MSSQIQDIPTESPSKDKSASNSIDMIDREAVVKLINNSGNQADEEFNTILEMTQQAISNGTYPELISAGSSGSIFIHLNLNHPINFRILFCL